MKRKKVFFGKKAKVSLIISKNGMVIQKPEAVPNKIFIAAKGQNPQADTSALEREIDQLVYKLYDLTPVEISIIEGNIKEKELK
jgi:hypothetical protein